MCKCFMHLAETRKIACRMGVIFSLTVDRREARSERGARDTRNGEDTCLALLARFALRSPKKRKKKKEEEEEECLAG